MKRILYAFAGFITLVAAFDIFFLGDVTRGLLGVLLATNILILGKVDFNSYDTKKREQDELLAGLVDELCEDCKSGKELYLHKDNLYYVHLEGPQEEWYEICGAHAIHNKLNSLATELEEGSPEE